MEARNPYDAVVLEILRRSATPPVLHGAREVLDTALCPNSSDLFPTLGELEERVPGV